MNSGKIENWGVETNIAYRFNARWQANANYSWLHMENPVLAAPEHKLYAGISYRQGRWTLTSGMQYIKGLYTSVGENENKENFVLWNLRASFRACKWLDIWARGENLLAQEYEINAGYPMPGATIMAGFNLSF